MSSDKSETSNRVGEASSACKEREMAMSIDTSVADVLRIASDLLGEGVDVCLATVIESRGSSPCTPGQKMLLGANGTAAGTVGGGAVEQAAVQEMKELLRHNRAEPMLKPYALEKDLGMACGGNATLLLEPMKAATPVLLVGAGHIGAALAVMLSRLGFYVIITDERPSALTKERFSGVGNMDMRLGSVTQVAQDVALRVPVLVSTHDHGLDEVAVLWAVKRGHVYVGGVGSRRKAIKIKDALKREGVSEEAIARFRMPVGLSIGGRSPEEIALSIAAELVAWRAGKLHALVSTQAPDTPA